MDKQLHLHKKLLACNTYCPDLQITEDVVKKVNSCKYLGVRITNNGSSKTEIKNTINRGNLVTRDLILWSKQIMSSTKINIFKKES